MTGRIVATTVVLAGLMAGETAAQAWQQYATPEEAGFNSAILDTTRLTGDRLQSGGVVVIYRGHVLAAWGDVARKLPLHMEDFQPTDGFRAYEPGLSFFPAHTWRMSARDLARFGQLYLQRGRWHGQQLIPEDWIARSTSPISDLGAGRGYGFMWWTCAPGSYGERYAALNRFASYAASGTGGQAIIVIPEAELVIVHRGDTDHNRQVAGGNVWALADRVLLARQAEPKPNPRLTPLAPVAFTSQLPPLLPPEITPPNATEVAALTGEYDFGQSARMRVTTFRSKLFLFFPGEGEAELLRIGPWHYTIAVQPGVTVEVVQQAGIVSELRVRIDDRTFSARRVR